MRSTLLVRTLFAALLAIGIAGTAAAQDATVFERVLVPISVVDVPGAYGTLWSTELWYRNHSNKPVAVFPLAVTDTVPTIGRTTRLPIGSFPPEAPGQILFVSRDGGADVQFDLRLFNRADPAASWGTKLPVVRERELADVVHLINVPTASAYRSTLRIYGVPDAVAGTDSVRVRIYSNSEELLADTDVELRGWPRYAAIASLVDRFPQIRNAERVRVHIEAQSVSAKIWAFVSVTSNATQQVSVVSPE